MVGLTGEVRVGLATLVAAATLVGFATTNLGTAEAARCYEKYIGEPIYDEGIYCPGDPDSWKSYAFASHGFGYYAESEDMGSYSRLRVGYKHKNTGRIAIAFFDCWNGNRHQTCWNGVPFPV